MKPDLTRFKTAQEGSYLQALQEIKNGRKTTHWMWYIFPQIAGLGQSAMAKKYEIADEEEAAAYLNDNILAPRLLEITTTLAYEIQDKTAAEIFGYPDVLKFHSCMTLFNSVVKKQPEFSAQTEYRCFEDALHKYYGGNPDPKTLQLLKTK